MAALRFSILAISFLCSCVHSQPHKKVTVESQVEGCFIVNNITLDMSQEPVLATASITNTNADCPCKSALMKYIAFQTKGGDTFNLSSGQFSILGKESVTLPVATQKQLIFPNTPINLSLSCSEN